MDIETMEMVVATVMLISMITVTIAAQTSNIDGISKVVKDWRSGEGKKIATSFNYINKEGFASTSRNSISSGTQELESGYCFKPTANLEDSDLIRSKVSGTDCIEPVKNVKTLIWSPETSETYLLWVGTEEEP